MCALISALVCITSIAASLKLAGVIDWSWWWVIGPPVCAAVIAAKFLRK